MELRTDVYLGLKTALNPPLMNGAGCVKLVEDVQKYARVPAIGAIVGGSYTINSGMGNNTPNFHYGGPTGSFNSIGLQNPGKPYIRTNGKEMVQICHDAGKQFIISVAASNPTDYVALIDEAVCANADGAEINVACGNKVIGDNARECMPIYDDEMFFAILDAISTYVRDSDFPFWFKMGYNPNMWQIKRQAAEIKKYPWVKALSLINTVANCYPTDEHGKSRISVGFAGMSGPPLKEMCKGQIMQWSKELPCVDMIAVGGITCGKDVLDYIRVGASAFQMTTEPYHKGPGVFERVLREFDEIESFFK
jgi:dihydroorotate dehydrogenase